MQTIQKALLFVCYHEPWRWKLIRAFVWTFLVSCVLLQEFWKQLEDVQTSGSSQTRIWTANCKSPHDTVTFTLCVYVCVLGAYKGETTVSVKCPRHTVSTVPGVQVVFRESNWPPWDTEKLNILSLCPQYPPTNNDWTTAAMMFCATAIFRYLCQKKTSAKRLTTACLLCYNPSDSVSYFLPLNRKTRWLVISLVRSTVYLLWRL